MNGFGYTGATGASGEIRYALPDPGGTEQWCQLGTWSTDISANRTCTLRLASQSYSWGFNRFRTAFLQLSSGNWSNLPQQALDGSTFHAWAELQLTSDWPDAGTRVVIEQVGQPTTPSLSFRVWVLLSNVAGTGHYTATPISTDTWTHSGTLYPVRPISQVLYPSVRSSMTAADTQAALDLKANLAGPTFTGTTTVANLTATGTVSVPDSALSIAKVSGLQTSLNAKANTTGPTTFTGLTTVANLTATGTVLGWAGVLVSR